MDKQKILKLLIKECLPHRLSRVLDILTEDQKADVKKFIKWSLDNENITRDEYNLIIKHTRRLHETKELQPTLIELWEVTDNEFPILAKERESGFIYQIENYWLNHELLKVNVSDYFPNKDDKILMYGTQYELINPSSIQIGYFEVR